MKKKWLNEDGTFKELTADEVNSLTDSEAKEYMSDKMQHIVKDEVSKSIESLNFSKKEDVELISTKLDELMKSNDIAELKANLEGLQEVVRNISKFDLDNKSNKKTFKDEIIAKGEQLKVREQNVVIEKDTLRSAVADYEATVREPGIAPVQTPFLRFMDVMNVTNDNNPNDGGQIWYMDYDEATITRNAAAYAEGGTIPKSDIGWKRYVEEYKKIGDSLVVTDEFFEDFAELAALLESFITENVDLAIEQELWDGTGVGEHLKGITTLVPTFDEVAYAASSKRKYPDANLADLFQVLKNEIMRGTKYVPNGALIPHDEDTLWGGAKDANAQYLTIPTHGITRVPSSYVTDNEMVLGDMTKWRAKVKKGYVMKRGFANNQINEDKITITTRKRLFAYIREVEKNAFLYVDDITAALAAISA